MTAARTLIVLTLAVAGLYGMSAASGNAQGDVCAASKPVTERLKPTATGEVAGVIVPEKPALLPNLSFRTPDGQAIRLDQMRGKVVLLNLWATWCAPCRKEMPALDRLQAELGGPDFEVVAVNIDQRNLDRPKTFLAEIGVTRLVQYADPSARIFTALREADRAFGMPTTLLIDRNGCELGFLSGPAEWASADALRMIKAALGR